MEFQSLKALVTEDVFSGPTTVKKVYQLYVENRRQETMLGAFDEKNWDWSLYQVWKTQSLYCNFQTTKSKSPNQRRPCNSSGEASPASNNDSGQEDQTLQARRVHKLYVGNLEPDVTEEILTSFFAEHGINVGHFKKIDLKGAYAFIECADQATADLAIDRCHRKSLQNMVLRVEPSFKAARSKLSRRNAFVYQRPPVATAAYEVSNEFVNYAGDAVRWDSSGVLFNGNYKPTKMGILAMAPPPSTQPTGNAAYYFNSIFKGNRGIQNYVPLSSASMAAPATIAAAPYIPEEKFRKLETMFTYIPDTFVGALIGKKGCNIRRTIHRSGANVKIQEFVVKMETISRRVSIIGIKESVIEALSMIARKLSDELRTLGLQEDLNIVTEICVPGDMVGHLIGKKGQRVREMQRAFRCKINFLTSLDPSYPQPPDDHVLVRISGSLSKVLACHEKFREMVQRIKTSFPNRTPQLFKSPVNNSASGIYSASCS